MIREWRIGIAIVAALGLFVFGMLLIGSIGAPRAELQQLTVPQVLREGSPADRYGSEELRIGGFYAELAADCTEHDLPTAVTVPWLEHTCPMRVLAANQPPETVTQAQLEEGTVRLSAPNGAPFPARAEPTGPNLRLQQLVFVGHFDDPAAAQCAPQLRQRCRDTFVVSDYSGLVR
ncbi:MAG TPA: hypothetical protein VHU77_00860 [Candidatus Limnocylindria bacterium]|nr:hypothetical protein [Candidatus Limnocylindria bacterium]